MLTSREKNNHEGFDSLTIPNIKHAANEYFFSFVWLDAHKKRENFWYLIIIVGVESYNDYQVFEFCNDYQVQVPAGADPESFGGGM